MKGDQQAICCLYTYTIVKKKLFSMGTVNYFILNHFFELINEGGKYTIAYSHICWAEKIIVR